MRSFRNRNPEAGFTLIEVMIALAVIGIAVVVLLDQRVDVVRDAKRARDLRAAWTLAGQKLAEIEMDPRYFTGPGSYDSGDFSDRDPAWAGYAWDARTAREFVPTNDPAAPQETPKEVYRLVLTLRVPSFEEADPLRLEADFPLTHSHPPETDVPPPQDDPSQNPPEPPPQENPP